VASRLDHTLLNEVLRARSVPLEHVTRWIAEQLKRRLEKLCEVEVCGPPSFCVTYHP
jgi:6-pyruvoyl-tetrahydropterin synthase